MAQKPERGRYVTLEDVRVSYKYQDDTIHITSSDPDIPNGTFYITLNRDTSTESALRELLTEHGLIRENPKTASPTTAVCDDPMPTMLAKVKTITAAQRSVINISGDPGTGKTTYTLNTIGLANQLNLNTVYIQGDSRYALASSTVIKVKNLPVGALDPFKLGLPKSQLPAIIREMARFTDVSSPDITNTIIDSLHKVDKMARPSFSSLISILEKDKDFKDNEIAKHMAHEFKMLSKEIPLSESHPMETNAATHPSLIQSTIDVSEYAKTVYINFVTALLYGYINQQNPQVEIIVSDLSTSYSIYDKFDLRYPKSPTAKLLIDVTDAEQIGSSYTDVFHFQTTIGSDKTINKLKTGEFIWQHGEDTSGCFVKPQLEKAVLSQVEAKTEELRKNRLATEWM